jgi:hypothetical protein
VAGGHDTTDVLLGLLHAADPVTSAVTAAHPQLTPDAVRDATTRPGPAGGQSPGRPAPDLRRVQRDFTARWRPLVRGGQLRPGRRLGCGELWLITLERSAGSRALVQTLGADPDEVRRTVLRAMTPASSPVPDWPARPPAPTRPGLLDQFLRRGRRAG